MRTVIGARARRACVVTGMLGAAICAAGPAAAQLTATRRPAASTATLMPRPIRFALAVRHSRLTVPEGSQAVVDGSVAPARAGASVTLQLLHRGHWQPVARARTGQRGRYRLRLRPRQRHDDPARVVVAAAFGDGGAARRVGRLRSFDLRAAQASWYGPGGTTACGETLDSGTLGVANRTLPCGTLVLLRYGHRSVRVPVIDRGPYVSGRDFDLTFATKRALGFGDLGTVRWARLS